MRRGAGLLGLAAAGLALASCQGGGSDIGPRFPPLPAASSKVSVVDAQNRGVVGAVVEVVGTAVRAVTGRNGRAELFASPTGRPALRIDGAAAAAVDADLLGTLTVAMSLPGGDIPAVFHLPDVGPSATASLGVGVQVGPAVVGNPLGAGGVLTVPAGTDVGMSNGATTLTLRTAALPAAHLPGELPAGDAILLGAGVYVDPPQVTFSPAVDLEVADDLLAPGPVTLYRQDPVTGEWGAVGVGTPGGGSIVATGAIAGGGLYAFGTLVTGGAVSGRVVDANGVGVPDALVAVDGRQARSDGAGLYAVTSVPATLGDGSPRSATVEVFPGGAWLPAFGGATVAMNGAAQVAAPDVTLDTELCGNIRLQHILRARAEPFRPARLSSLFGGVALAATGDALGQYVFEDVPTRWFGFQEGFPKDHVFTFYGQAIGFHPPGSRWLDAFQFFDDFPWFAGGRSTRALVTDAVGGGPLFEVPVIRGSTPDIGLVARTREGGLVVSERSFAGRATAALRTQRGAETIVHAFSIDTPNGEHVELPMRQVLRAPLGAFDRHGLVGGMLIGADVNMEHRLRATRRIELREWWEQAVFGAPILSRLPIDVDPAVTHGPFLAGVDRVGGNLAAAEVQTAAGVTTLLVLGVAADVEPVEGAVTTLDVPLAHAATDPFTAPGALAGLDAAIAPGALTFDLALELPSGLVVDVVAGIGGNHAPSGADVALTLPPLTGTIQGHAWVAMLGGTATTAAGTVSQRCMLRFPGPTAANAATMLPVPVITAPAPSASVGSGGFTVQYSLPPGAQYATLELRSTSPGELLLWEVTLPPTSTEFTFVRLPTGVDTPLQAGKSYSLTLTAYAASPGAPTGPWQVVYRDFTPFLQSIGPAERGVDAVSSRTIQISTP